MTETRVGTDPARICRQGCGARSGIALTEPLLPLLADAFGVAANYGRTVYDFQYVAPAVVSGRVLVTADERLAKALEANFPSSGWEE